MCSECVSETVARSYDGIYLSGLQRLLFENFKSEKKNFSSGNWKAFLLSKFKLSKQWRLA